MISQVEPQKIVERLNNILSKNINMFNTKGIIIASNDLSRIGTFHSAALECIEHSVTVIISKENRAKYPNCKEGINLPLLYEDRVIGAVGITGDPEQVRGYGLIVKELVEHIHYESSIKSSDALYQEMVKMFFYELFHSTDRGDSRRDGSLTPQTIEELEEKALSLHIDYKGCTLVACILDDVKSLINPTPHYSVQDIILYIRQSLGYCFTLHDNRFLGVARKTYRVEKRLKELQEEIQRKFHILVRFLYTDPCETLTDYPVQYNLIQQMSKLHAIQGGSQTLYRTRDLQELFLLENIAPDQRKGYLSLYKKFFQEENPQSSPLIATVKSYFEQNLSIKATALTLGIHRNTVVYRLQQCVDRYGIDVFSAPHCMRLYLAILMKQNSL